MRTINVTRLFPNVPGWNGEVWEVENAINARVVQMPNGSYRVVVHARKSDGSPRELFAGAGLTQSQAQTFADDINSDISEENADASHD